MNRKWKTGLVGARGLSKWVRSGGSLTMRIMEKCGQFSVRHVSNRFARANLDELGRIGAKRNESVLVREVCLCCADKPVVFAHSVALRSSLKGPWRNLRFLGQKSLGSAYLSNPRVGRDDFEFLSISSRHPLYEKSCRYMKVRPDALWARRSLFFTGKCAILVTEVFLPEISELA
jgi:chorismate--pyruvate lyase